MSVNINADSKSIVNPVIHSRHVKVIIAFAMAVFFAVSSVVVTPAPAEAVSANTYKSYVKKYCGKGYKFKSNQNLRSGVLALASGNTLLFSKRLNSKGVTMRKYAARHECSHMLQFRTYGDFNTLVKKSNKIFKTRGYNGVEKLADCMAQKMGSPKKVMRYQKNCSNSAKKAAAKLIKRKRV